MPKWIRRKTIKFNAWNIDHFCNDSISCVQFCVVGCLFWGPSLCVIVLRASWWHIVISVIKCYIMIIWHIFVEYIVIVCSETIVRSLYMKLVTIRIFTRFWEANGYRNEISWFVWVWEIIWEKQRYICTLEVERDSR